MTGLRYELTGKEATLATLAKAAARADLPRELWDEIGGALVVSTQQRFEQGRGPSGSPWPQSIRALAEGGRTLVQSGRLMNSMTHNASDHGVEVGTNVIYAAIHQMGGKITAKDGGALTFELLGRTIMVKSVTIPARPFLGLDAEDEQEIIAIAGEYLGGSDAH